MTKTTNLVTDLRHLDFRDRLQASAELKAIIRSWSLQRPAEELNERLSEDHEKPGAEHSSRESQKHAHHDENGFHDDGSVVVDLNLWIAARSRRGFE